MVVALIAIRVVQGAVVKMACMHEGGVKAADTVWVGNGAVGHVSIVSWFRCLALR